MKRYRVHIAIGLLVSSFVATIGLFMWRDREPRNAGVPLSELLRQARTPIFVHSYYLNRLGAGPLELGREHAEGAIRQIGTNAIPWLLEELQAQDPPPWRAKLNTWAGKIGIWTNRVSAAMRVAQAKDAFRILGPIAKPAAPAILELKTNKLFNSEAAYRVVAAVDPDTLVGKLRSKNETDRRRAACGLGQCDTNACPCAVPALMRAMENDPESNVRYAAAEALSYLYHDRSFVLHEGLAEKDPEVRDNAVRMELLRDFHFRKLPGVIDMIQRLTPELRSEAIKSLGRVAKYSRAAGPILQAVALGGNEQAREAVKAVTNAVSSVSTTQQ